MENPNLKWIINGVQYTSILGNVHSSYKNGHLEGVIIIFSLILPFSELYMGIPDFQTHPSAVNLVLKSINGCVASRNAPDSPVTGDVGIQREPTPPGVGDPGNNVWVCLSRANLLHQQPLYI